MTAIIGSLLSWVGSFLLYGFGQLIENSDILIEQSRNNKSNLVEHLINIQKVSQNEANIEKVGFARPIPSQDDNIICSNCRREQLSGRAYCRYCFAKFVDTNYND